MVSFVKKLNYFYFIVFVLTILTYLLPNYYDPWRTAYHEFLIFGVFILLLIKLTINNIFYFDKKLIWILILGFIPLIQFCFGRIFFFGDAFIVFIYILGFFLAVILGLNYSKSYGFDNILKFICAILVIVGIISLYIILKQWLLLTNGGIWTVDVPPGGRPFANFAQPNNCATFLCMGLVGTLYIYEKKYVNKLTCTLLACLILLGIALTQSRTAWVFFLCFIIWWNWKYKIIQPRTRRNMPLFFLCLFILFAISIPILSNFLGVLNTSNLIERTSGGYLRLPMWNQLILAIIKEPIWGYGWNQVSVAQMTIYLDYPTTEWTEHAHNIILDLFIWNGIPIATLIIVCIVLWFYYLNKITISVEVFFALAIVGAVLVHGMLEYPLEYGFFLLPVGFILGLVQSTDDNKSYLKFSTKGFYLIIPLFLIVYIWVLFEYKIIENDTRILRFEMLNIGEVHAEKDAPNVYLLTQLRERNRFSRTEPTANMSKAEIQWMHMIAQRYTTAAYLYRYSQALALNGYPDQARRNLLIIEQLHGKKYSFESLYEDQQSLAFKWKQQGISNP